MTRRRRRILGVALLVLVLAGLWSVGPKKSALASHLGDCFQNGSTDPALVAPDTTEAECGPPGGLGGEDWYWEPYEHGGTTTTTVSPTTTTTTPGGGGGGPVCWMPDGEGGWIDSSGLGGATNEEDCEEESEGEGVWQTEEPDYESGGGSEASGCWSWNPLSWFKGLACFVEWLLVPEDGFDSLFGPIFSDLHERFPFVLIDYIRWPTDLLEQSAIKANQVRGSQGYPTPWCYYVFPMPQIGVEAQPIACGGNASDYGLNLPPDDNSNTPYDIMWGQWRMLAVALLTFAWVRWVAGYVAGLA